MMKIQMMIFKMSRVQKISIVILSLFTFECYAETAVNSVTGKNEVIEKNMPAIAPGAVPGNASATVAKTNTSTNAMELYAEQWEIARSGETLLTLPVLNRLVTAWLDDRQKLIEIQYPGGEEGEFWVQELTDWLVSLGIPSVHMVTAPGSGSDDIIRFKLIK